MNQWNHRLIRQGYDITFWDGHLASHQDGDWSHAVFECRGGGTYGPRFTVKNKHDMQELTALLTHVFARGMEERSKQLMKLLKGGK